MRLPLAACLEAALALWSFLEMWAYYFLLGLWLRDAQIFSIPPHQYQRAFWKIPEYYKIKWAN
jgi:hypothetical protein